MRPRTDYGYENISSGINSIGFPGGMVTSGFVIHYTMRFVRAQLHTLCMGTARSVGSFLLMAGVASLSQYQHHHPSIAGDFQAQDMLIPTPRYELFPLSHQACRMSGFGLVLIET
ncbi:ATP-dependent Clp protease proteolytic subunit [Asticcacaulis sp. EMRT-3]|uniref:ATP-dependent Clp protease proteolytic subunit n=1 Tax=Asticcacaulis sp. EMRT-3 TaxID=3040349 RepID=UPI0024AFFEDF|nr:ATP-dependent Clp protease proteolytic subunit [Asticcacaulis sp. EMRT-3]MDI7773908.1 ATP-dependent Clp protease proteolytic subunit [Asticcacaulis sp. EMRT-3]